MYLSRLSISNFRNIQSLELQFSGGLNILVGENNVGKTNVVDAIRIALGQLNPTIDDIPFTAEGEDRQKPIRITLEYASLSDDEQAQFLEILNYNTARPSDSTAQINYEWAYIERTKRWTRSRWGGRATESERSVPDDILQSLPVSALDALRNPTDEFRAGPNNRLAKLIDILADETQRGSIKTLFSNANDTLKADSLITSTLKAIDSALEGASGTLLKQESKITQSEARFDRIIQTLRLVVDDERFPLVRNGLGYNNILHIACVIAELGKAIENDHPLLLIEEPEAHLHPQLQTILGSFLSEGIKQIDGFRKPQIIVSTHSPTIASHVSPLQLRFLHRRESNLHFFSLEGKIAPEQLNKLRRMLDVTRASMFFARGVIFVEGESEALLLPVLAKREGYDLEQSAVSIVPVNGVSFKTLGDLFGDEKINMKVALVTDADPGIVGPNGEDDPAWRDALPQTDASGFITTSQRVKDLISGYQSNTMVKVFTSDITLEHSLASAGNENPSIMTTAWEKAYSEGTPRNLNQQQLQGINTLEEKALFIWRAVCLASTKIGKPIFAQQLAEELSKKNENGAYVISKESFDTPTYLLDAIRHVCISRSA